MTVTATFVVLWVAGVAVAALGIWWLAAILLALACCAGCRFWLVRQARKLLRLAGLWYILYVYERS